ncbi:DUF2752 domain-containing protein [Streptomyces sp. TRM66268-LWL]|uniref:DUF2752 domain-containing protein n=1 Tax=Streptomyces polyasparticus TaxID=2767826 RepID=A0ABR7SC16_9ACTN|nr:DUF2752 domain-containing protein [Streptomyces polyasparticus]
MTAEHAEQPSGSQQWAPQPVAPRTGASRARRLLAPVAALGATAAAVAYVGAVDPNEAGHYPTCPLLAATGLYCPGCGGLRCVHALVQGDLPAALGANVMAVTGFVIAAFVWVLWLRRAWRGGPTGLTIRSSYAWAFGGLLAVFTVVRNLPFGSFLHP